MATPLLQVVRRQGERERDAILRRAREEAEGILAAARADAEHQLQLAPAAALHAAPCPALGTERARLLQLYTDKVATLKAAVVERVARLDPARQHRLLTAVLEQVLGGLEPGVYRLEAPAPVWEELQRRNIAPAGRSLRWSGSGSETVRLYAENGRIAVVFSLPSMVEQHFASTTTHMDELLCADEHL